MAREIRDLLNELGIKTSERKLYKRAFTHPSFSNEKKSSDGDYERLEFIGDGVLDLSVADIVYRLYPKLNQGDLSKIRINFVNGKTLAQYAKKYGFESLVIMGHGQKTNGGTNDKILEDVFEAFLGAVYLDKGYDFVYQVVCHIFLEDIKSVPMDVLKDYKSQLQEFVQADTRNSVTYRLISETGNPPNTEFVVEVMWDNQVYGQGKGSSKKKAEQEAAKAALSKVAR
jgi:ribonuclease-3